MNTFESLSKPEQTLLTSLYTNSPLVLKSKFLTPNISFLTKLRQNRSETLEITSGFSASLEFNPMLNGLLKVQKSSKGLSKLLLLMTQSKELYTATGLIQYKVCQHGLHLRNEPQIGFSYLTENGSFEVRLKNNPLIMNLSLTSIYQNLTFSGALNLAMYSQKYTEYAMAISKSTELYKLLIKHTTSELNLGTFYLSYFLNLSKNTKFASILTTDWHNKLTEVQFGFEHIHDSNTFKGKVSSAGHLLLLVSRNVSSQFKVTVSADLDLKDMTSNKVADYNIGVLVNFNYEV